MKNKNKKRIFSTFQTICLHTKNGFFLSKNIFFNEIIAVFESNNGFESDNDYESNNGFWIKIGSSFVKFHLNWWKWNENQVLYQFNQNQ